MSRFPAVSLLLCFLLIRVGDAQETSNSGRWLLPGENFDFFFRLFREKLTWDEARRVCEFHRGALVTAIDENAMDVLRTYLKESNVFTRVWIGLKKGASRSDFYWINGEQVRGDGYWLEPAPKSGRRLCAAADPAVDFRWTIFHCGGPETAEFVCQQKVPSWAKDENGCMINELPSISITLEPERGVIELTSDCGLFGTRRIACRGKINRGYVIKHLSCEDDPFTEKPTERARGNNVTYTMRTPHKEATTQTIRGWTSTERLTRH